jgi:hypothetical protein
MKNYIIILFLCSFCSNLNAQGNLVNEIFRQNSTQRKYLIQQIAALKVYSGYLKKGYNIYKSGHNAISGFKNGELNLHRDYFISLQNVNPQIARYPKVSDIINMQKRIVQICNHSLKHARDNAYIRPEEITYIDRVYKKLLKDCSQLTEDVHNIITSSKLQMEDDERLQRIDVLYEEVKDNYKFAETFSADIELLSKARQQEALDVHTVNGLHR